MMKIINILIFILFITTINAQLTIAIADFKNNSNELYLDNWERMIPEYLKSELTSSKNLLIVERQNLEAVLKEQALGMTGLIDSSTAQKVGQLLGAQLIITGIITKEGKWYRIDAKIIRVSTGQVYSEKVRTKNDQHLSEMVQLLANNIINVLTREKDYCEKQELKKYPTKYFLIATIGLTTGTILVHNVYKDEYDQYHSANTLEDIALKYDRANKAHKTRNILATLSGTALVGTIYCWLKNLSPDVIYANNKITYLPNLVLYDNNGVYIGVKVYF